MEIVPGDGRATTAAAALCVVRGHNGYREVRKDGSILVACYGCGYALEERKTAPPSEPAPTKGPQ